MLAHLPDPYMHLRAAASKHRDYGQVAYLDGFLSGVAQFKRNDKRRLSLPLYYLYGVGVFSNFTKYKKALREARGTRKGSYEYAVEKIAPMPSEGYVIHRKPYPFLHQA